MHARLLFFVASWACSLALGASLAAAGEGDWPQFRGPRGQGVAESTGLPNVWSATENIAWKVPIAGRGWSSPIVWGDRIFLTTVTSADDREERKRGIYFGGDPRDKPQAPHQWRVVCLDRRDGHQLWEQVAHEGIPPEAVHRKNTYASETPATDGERVYAYFGNLGVFCYSLSGELLWTRPLGSYKIADGMGTGSSPTLFGGRLFVVNDNEEKSFLTAIDGKTGNEVWRVARTEKTGWATPYIWRNGTRTEVVVSGSAVARAYDLDGQPLWHLGNMSGQTIPSPVSSSEYLFLASGHVLDGKRPIAAVRPGAQGDITLSGQDTSNEFVAWSLRKASPYSPSLLYYGDYVYAVTDLGILSCLDAHDGHIVYERKRLPNGRAVTASPWAYNGQVFCLSEYGETFVIKAGPEFELIRVNALPDEELYLSTPAIAGEQLLIRSEHHLYAIQQAPAKVEDQAPAK